MACQEKKARIETEDQIGTPTAEGPRDKAHRTMEEFLGRRVENLDRCKMLWALLRQLWDALELCRLTQEEFFEKKLPLRGILHTMPKLTAEFRKILVEARKNDELEWRKQMAMGKSFSLPPLSDSAKQALEQILPQFSPEDRMILRQILDRGRAEPPDYHSV